MKMRRLCGLRRLLILSLSGILLMILSALILHRWYTYYNLAGWEQFEINEFVAREKGQSCVQPRLPLWPDESFRRFFVDVPKPNCGPDDWVYVDQGRIRFSESAVKRYGKFTCTMRPLIRADDFHTTLGEQVTVTDGGKIPSDFFKISCFTSEGLDGPKYYNYHYGIFETDKAQTKPIPGRTNHFLDLNVLIFGFDSVSRLTWMRKLPKTYDYLTKTLGAVVLEGYNIVGDGTPAALLPILTGNLTELHDANKNHPAATPVDDYPWIWDEFAKRGYVTQFSEDGARYATFNYRMRGFTHQPTDHYMRTFYLMSEYYQNYCHGSKVIHNLMLEYVRDFFLAYPTERKFSFGFHNQLSHDNNNPLSIVDEDLREFLKFFEEKGLLDNTLLIVMSDHGARFQQLRNTIQGNYEERNPFFSITVPQWFRSKYPQNYENLRGNARRLTTPFDVHETLKSVLDFQTPTEGDVRRRGISLFSSIPKTRTCEHAAIEPHWCSCLNWQRRSPDNALVVSLGEEFVRFINSMLVEELCHPLQLDRIFRASKMETNPDFSTTQLFDYYQISVQTTPGQGQFEFTVKVSKVEDEHRMHINTKSISRINMYGHVSDCIGETHPQLRPYCVCRGV